jgi:hypothetical protein
MSEYPVTERTRVRRLATRAHYDRENVYAILDEALVAHVGFVAGGQPVVLPMAFVRVADSVFLHGSTKARMLESISDGAPVCVTATLIDALVLARSAFHHSMNYRSVTILGSGRAVDDDRALMALEALTEKLAAGRWPHIRLPNEQEMKATRVVEIPIEEVSAKIRTGGPIDDAEDMDLDIWAGCVPLRIAYAEAVADPLLKDGVALPDHVRRLASPPR